MLLIGIGFLVMVFRLPWETAEATEARKARPADEARRRHRLDTPASRATRPSESPSPRARRGALGHFQCVVLPAPTQSAPRA